MEPFTERSCPNCGAVVNLGDEQCSSCGTKILSEPGEPGDLRNGNRPHQDDQQIEASTDRVRMLLAVIISIIIIVGITEIGMFNIY